MDMLADLPLAGLEPEIILEKNFFFLEEHSQMEGCEIILCGSASQTVVKG